jgi:hypothetical protein
MRKQDYLEGLKAAEADNPEPQAALPLDPKQDEPAKTENPPKPTEPVKAEPKVEEPPKVAEPVAAEPFKGWNLLDEETRKSLEERWTREAKLEEDFKRQQKEYAQSQSRLAPTQQQLAKLQADYSKAQKQLREHESKHQNSLSEEAKRRLEQFKKQYPDESEMLEILTNQAYKEAEAARKDAEATRKKLEAIEQRQNIGDQLRVLSDAHPDWKQARGSLEFETWYGALDPYARELIGTRLHSNDARDAIYVLNEFKRDLAWAQTLRTAPSSEQPRSSAAQPTTATPVADPDPSRRTTAPVTAGQPISDKKRQLIEAAAFLRKQQRHA